MTCEQIETITETRTRVENLEKWQARQNGHLRRLDEGQEKLRDMMDRKIVDVQKKVDAVHSQINTQRNALIGLLAGAIIQITLTLLLN